MNIYSKNTFTDLADFQANGGFSVSGGKIVTTADATKYIRLPNVTCLDQYTVSVLTKWVSGSGEALGYIRMESVNSLAVESLSAFIVTTAGANYGKVAMYDSYFNTTYYSTAALAPVVNDRVTVTLSKTPGSYTATATIGAKTVTISRGIFTPGNIVHNACKVSFYGTLNIQNIEELIYSTPFAFHANTAAFGDSITYGGNVTDPIYRWASVIKAAAVMGGPGDKVSAEFGLRINDVNTTVVPRWLFLMGLTNDLAFGVSQSTRRSAYQALVDNIEANGYTTVIKVTPIPSNSFDSTGDAAWILSTWPDSSIDVNTPLRGSGTSLNSIYNNDDVHPNDAGHAKIAEVIMSHPLYKATIVPNVYGGQANVIIAKTSTTFEDALITSTNTSIIYRIGNPNKSYKPGRLINGMDAFEPGVGYYIIAKQNMDLSEF